MAQFFLRKISIIKTSKKQRDFREFGYYQTVVLFRIFIAVFLVQDTKSVTVFAAYCVNNSSVTIRNTFLGLFRVCNIYMH